MEVLVGIRERMNALGEVMFRVMTVEQKIQEISSSSRQELRNFLESAAPPPWDDVHFIQTYDIIYI